MAKRRTGKKPNVVKAGVKHGASYSCGGRKYACGGKKRKGRK